MSIIVGNRTLRQLLEYRAATTPDKPFVIYDDLEGGVTQLSYAELPRTSVGKIQKHVLRRQEVEKR